MSLNVSQNFPCKPILGLELADDEVRELIQAKPISDLGQDIKKLVDILSKITGRYDNKGYCRKILSMKEVPFSFLKTAIEYRPDILLKISNPTEDIALTAISLRPELITKLENPADKLWIVAIHKDSSLFLKNKNPSNEVTSAALACNGQLLEDVESPSRDQVLNALRNNGLALAYVKDPDKEMIETALTSNCMAIKYIENQTEGMQAFCATISYESLKFMYQPSLEVYRIGTEEMKPAIKKLGFTKAFLESKWGKANADRLIRELLNLSYSDSEVMTVYSLLGEIHKIFETVHLLDYRASISDELNG
ncbi:MAG: DUF4116 domain-containing protein [Methyloprofundus sp.]|nr:DUF4116 domain-containing protein [Methyloprofundus sp.]